MPPPQFRRPGPRGVNHPYFTRLSPTVYRLRYVDYAISITVHVAQIAEFLRFDEEIRKYHKSSQFNSYPLGYLEFSNVWNEGAPPDDPRRLSILRLADDPKDNTIEPSETPLHISDFHVTAAQVGLTADDEYRPSAASQNNIAHEYANLMAEKQRKQREFIEERRQRRIRAFDNGQFTHPGFRGPANVTTPIPNNNKRARNRRNRNKKGGLNKDTAAIPTDNHTPTKAPEETAAPSDTTTPSTPMDVAH